MPLKQVKTELRTEMRRILQNIDPRWLVAASKELSFQLERHLLGPDSDQIESVLGWIPYFRGEPDLSAVLSKIARKKRLFLPKILSESKMVFVEVGEQFQSQLETGSFGVPQPQQQKQHGFEVDRVFDPYFSDSTAVLVPGLAFDRLGARIGRGKGYYDRFLADRALKSIKKIGICWSLQVVPEVPTEPHDCFMNLLCHERGIQYLQ